MINKILRKKLSKKYKKEKDITKKVMCHAKRKKLIKTEIHSTVHNIKYLNLNRSTPSYGHTHNTHLICLSLISVLYRSYHSNILSIFSIALSQTN